MRLTERTLRELETRLGVLDGGPALDWFTPALSELLGGDPTGHYAVQAAADGSFRLARGAFVGLPPRPDPVAGLVDFIRSIPARWGLFDPARPEPAQRNRALATPSPGSLARALEEAAEPSFRRRHRVGVAPHGLLAHLRSANQRIFDPIGTTDMPQLRVLVCDGPSLLAWVGAFRPEGSRPEERRALERLVPALQRRLRLERLLECHDVDAAALGAALERVPGAAFVATAGRAVVQANGTARARLESDCASLVERLEAALRGKATGLEVVEIRAAGLAPSFLVLERPDATERAAAFAERLGLSPRQRAVFAHLVRGEANKTIAARLGCAENTVELHVTALLQRADVGTRAALIARLWTEG